MELMTADGSEIFSFPDVTWQEAPPPVRHPVPARYAGDLHIGDEVTIGVPDDYFVDHQVLTRDIVGGQMLPQEGDEPDIPDPVCVASPYSYWLHKAWSGSPLLFQWWPIDRTWVYRDAVNPGQAPEEVHGAPDAVNEPRTWFDRIRPGLDTPPVRQPRRAREAESLTGQHLRMQHQRGQWSWWVAVSEPVDQAGDFIVRVMEPKFFWLAQARSIDSDLTKSVGLHRLFIYT